MVVPYSQGIAESFKNICRKYGIQVYFKGGKTLKKPTSITKRQGQHQEEKQCNILVQM